MRHAIVARGILSLMRPISQEVAPEWSRGNLFKIDYKWGHQAKIWNHLTLSFKRLIFRKNISKQRVRFRCNTTSTPKTNALNSLSKPVKT